MKWILKITLTAILLRMFFLSFFSGFMYKFNMQGQEDEGKQYLRENSASNESSTYGDADKNKGIYIKPDFSLILPAFRKLKRINIDYPFHHFVDDYGLVDSAMSEQETIEALREVSNIWIKANIFVRFKIADVLNAKKLLPGKADAYKWWVTSPKAPSGNKDSVGYIEREKRYLKGIEQLKNGPGQLGKKHASLVSEKMLHLYNGHALLNWILDIGAAGNDIAFYHIYTVYYYAWYNGGTSKGRIFVRSGTCNGDDDERKRLKTNNEMVVCRGWKVDPEETFDSAVFVRVLAHEIGHSLGLQHPSRDCQIVDHAEDMDLMRQQRAVSTQAVGGCSENNPVARHSRHVSTNEYEKARVKAKSLERRQKAFYDLHPGTEQKEVSPTEFKTVNTEN